MDLSTALNAVTTAAVVIGVVFGLFELRQALRARREHAAVEVVRSVESPEIRRAVAKILLLPIDADPQLIRSDPAVLDAARLVHWAGEMFGAIVFEGVVDLHTLDRMNGGWLRAAWSTPAPLDRGGPNRDSQRQCRRVVAMAVRDARGRP